MRDTIKDWWSKALKWIKSFFTGWDSQEQQTTSSTTPDTWPTVTTTISNDIITDPWLVEPVLSTNRTDTIDNQKFVDLSSTPIKLKNDNVTNSQNTLNEAIDSINKPNEIQTFDMSWAELLNKGSDTSDKDDLQQSSWAAVNSEDSKKTKWITESILEFWADMIESYPKVIDFAKNITKTAAYTVDEALSDRIETFVWYDADSNKYLTMNIKDWYDWAFSDAYVTLVEEANRAKTQEQIRQAYQNFYNSVWDAFIVQWSDYTPNNWTEELKMLNTKAGNFKPTENQINLFLEWYQKNLSDQIERIKSYWIDTEAFEFWDAEEEEAKWERNTQWRNTIMNQLSPVISKLDPDKAMNVTLFISEILDNQLRRYNEPYSNVKYYADKIREEKKSWYTEEEQRVLDTYEWFQKAIPILLDNITNIYRAKLSLSTNWWIEEIIDTIWWMEFNEALQKGIREALNYEWDWNDLWWLHSATNDYLPDWVREQTTQLLDMYSDTATSVLDMMEMQSTIALNKYKATQEDNLIYKWIAEAQWSELLNNISLLGNEAFQQGAMGLMVLWWGALNLLTGWKYDLTEKALRQATLMNEDFTLANMYTTNQASSMRTIEKYFNYWLEYAPELIGNIWWIGKLNKWVLNLSNLLTRVRKGWRIASWFRKVASWLSRWQKAIDKIWLTNTIQKATEVAWDIANVEQAAQKVNTWSKILRWESKWNTVADFAVSNTLDIANDMFVINWLVARSDPESASDASLKIAAAWTLFGNVIPALWKTDLLKVMWWNLWKWYVNNRWDVLWFIEQNPDLFKKIIKSNWALSAEQLADFSKGFSVLSDAAVDAIKQLSPEAKQWVNLLYKEKVWDAIKQSLNITENSQLWKQIRTMIRDWRTNWADIIKMFTWFPWTLEIWPFTSTIRFKNWTTRRLAWYESPSLDLIDWWFANKLSNWFDEWDIAQISDNTKFSDALAKEGGKYKYFDEVDGKYYLNEKGMDYFKVNVVDTPNVTLWVTLSEAENTREVFKNIVSKMSGKHISEETINMIADTWTYDEVTNVIKEFIC